MRKISTRIRLSTHRTTGGLLCHHKTSILMKTKLTDHITMFGVISSDGDVMSPLIFPRNHRINMEAYTKCLQEVVQPWIEWLLKDPTSGNRMLCHASSAGEPSLGCLKNFCNHISSNIWSSNSPDYNPLDYCE